MIRIFSSRNTRLKILCAIALFLSAASLHGTRVAGAAEKAKISSEEQVKAAFLFSFVKFIDWPSGVFAAKNSPILIGTIGDDPLGGELRESLHGKNVNGRELVVQKIDWPGETEGLHILLICASEAKSTPEVLASVKGNPVLTIGEMEQFGQQGGIINFYIQEKKVRFEINIDAANKARLKISSQLLSLARIIRDNPREGGM